MQKAALATVGCKVNQYETQVIKERLERAGYRLVPFPSSADVYVINTCSVTARADRKSLYLARQASRKNSLAKILVTGCMVEADTEKIKEKIPRAKIVKNVDKLKIDTLLSSPNSVNGDFTIHRFSGHERAFVKVEDGCNQLCSYCRVPYVRGVKIRSRHPEEIIFEVRNLCDAGYKEIVLTGVNLALYGRDLNPRLSLLHLLKRLLDKLSNAGRIRLSSLEPHLIPQGLLELMVSSCKICPHLHLPLQSGNGQILKKMGRRYTPSQIKNLLGKFRERLPEVGVTGDVMVGFPGEGEGAFQNTLDFLKEIKPHRLHIFTFSPRHETPAAKMKPKVPENIKKRRSRILKQLSVELSREFIDEFSGKSLPVLVESKRDPGTGYLTGYTHNYIRVVILPEDNNVRVLTGKIVPVRITQTRPGYAIGKLESI